MADSMVLQHEGFAVEVGDDGVARVRDLVAASSRRPAVTVDLLSDILAKVEGDVVMGRAAPDCEALGAIASAAIACARDEAKSVAIYRDVLTRLGGSAANTAVGRLYVAESGDAAMVKVGHTRQPVVMTRIRQLRAAGEKPWRLLTDVSGSRAQEQALHRTLSRWRHDKAEYYRSTPELMSHLRQYAGGMLQLTIGAQS